MVRIKILFGVILVLSFFLFLITGVLHDFNNKKIGGSPVKSGITQNGQYLVKDSEGNVIEISESEWNLNWLLYYISQYSAIFFAVGSIILIVLINIRRLINYFRE